MITEDLALLYELKKQLRNRKKAYDESVQGLKTSIKSLESSITEQVIEAGKTVQFGGIRAEYRPTVVIRMKKEQETE